MTVCVCVCVCQRVCVTRPILSNNNPTPTLNLCTHTHTHTHTHNPKHAAVKWNIKAFVISLQAGAGADPKTERGRAREVGKNDAGRGKKKRE